MIKKIRFAVVIFVAFAVALSVGGAVVRSEQTDSDNSAHHALTEQEGEEKGMQEEEQGEQDQKNLAAQAKISEEQAKEIAEKAANGTATEAELDEQNGQVVYEVDVGDKEVIVNAVNGKVISIGNDDSDDDSDDDDDENNNN